MSGFMQLRVEVLKPKDLEELDNDPDAPIDIYWHAKAHEKGRIWGARYSASGYMDCTDYCFSHKGPIDAAKAAFTLFGDDEPNSEDRRELAQIIKQARAQGYRT